jgi:hypothetical protein
MSRPRVESTGGITTIESLRTHLQWTIELEHMTIPSYLCALYSVDSARNAEAAEVIHSIVLEEMLHLALAASLLNAVGGSPELDHPRLLPAYPRSLPHVDLSLVVPFGPQSLELFLRIERPSAVDTPAQDDGYGTIGQFYEAIRRSLIGVCDDLGEATGFCGDPTQQEADTEFRGGPGRVFEVTGIETASKALALIVVHGEGTAHVDVWDGGHDMFHRERSAVGHYYRLRQLEVGRRYQPGDTPITGPTGMPIFVDWAAIQAMRPNPRSSEYLPGSPIRTAMEQFNRIYCTVLRLLEQSFDGHQQRLGAAIGMMFRLMAITETLMRLPNEDGSTPRGPASSTSNPAIEVYS